MFDVAESAASAVQVQKVKDIIQSPLAMHELMDSADRDLTFFQSLPNEPLRMFSSTCMMSSQCSIRQRSRAPSAVLQTASGTGQCSMKEFG